MTQLLRFYKRLNILSIDVALGAVFSSAWLANFFQAQLRIYAYCALGLTVWIIYTADHLLDAKRIKHRASSERHQFHQHNFQVLLATLIFATMADLGMVFFVRPTVLYSGLFLSMIIAVYLLFNRWLGSLKECFVALLYCGGILLPIGSIAGMQVIYHNKIIVLIFFITALINVILFSWFDREKDKADNQRSLVLVLGDLVTRRFIYTLFTIQLLLGMYGVIELQAMLSFFVVLFIMNSVLLIIFLNWKWFSVDDKYRLAGDAIFFLPLLHLLLF